VSGRPEKVAEAVRLAQATASILQSVRCCICVWAIGEGLPMQNIIEDCLKPRLTESVDILTAVNILRARGYDQDDLIAEITRLFYVDLDEYNLVMRRLAFAGVRYDGFAFQDDARAVGSAA
jgi:hypothetical protein